jgi:spermidine/putrescine transport system ATP-binding protein
VRPEKIALGEEGGPNRLTGTVAATAYIGVATQVVVDTPDGTVQVFAQNIDSGSRVPAPESPVTLSWSPETTFVVESVPIEQEKEAA